MSSAGVCRWFAVVSMALVLGGCDREVEQINGGGDAGAGDVGEADVEDLVEPAPFGLDERPPNPSCVAPVRPVREADVDIERAFENLTFSNLVWLEQAPGDDSRWYAIEQTGRVRMFDDDPAVETLEDFIDIRGRVASGGEMGLLGMAFDPRWQDNGYVYLSYTAAGPRRSVLSRFEMDGEVLDPESELVMLEINQPYGNHNGGQILFGPDQMLYYAMGDGGSGGDPQGHGQNIETLLGTIMRVIPTEEGYEVPENNPFVGHDEGRDEIYAWGLRNPWRVSFDAETGEFWVADVGQVAREEINIVELGGNYGWADKEGVECFDVDPCDDGPWIDPVIDYSRSVGRSVTGGYVYRGSGIPNLVGDYVFGDYVDQRVWRLVFDAAGEPSMELLFETGFPISSFAEGNDRALYVLDYSGRIFRVVAGAGDVEEDDFPRQLSQTGCVDPEDPRRPAPGVIPYEPVAPFWSDGAEKERYFALPDGENIDAGQESWELPVGSVTMKHFRIGDRYVETRLFVRHDDGEWGGYSYEWNEEQTDAVLLPAGKVVEVAGQTWIYPSSANCMTCHTEAAGRTLGLETAQLNGEFVYESSNRRSNQLQTLRHIGVFEDDPGEAQELNALVDPGGDGTLDERARAYLHTNCANCHVEGAALRTEFNMRWESTLSEAGCDTDVFNDLGIEEPRVIAPGDPARSMAWVRAGRRDAHGMPPLGSDRVDEAGMLLLEQWIEALESCE